MSKLDLAFKIYHIKDSNKDLISQATKIERQYARYHAHFKSRFLKSTRDSKAYYINTFLIYLVVLIALAFAALITTYNEQIGDLNPTALQIGIILIGWVVCSFYFIRKNLTTYKYLQLIKQLNQAKCVIDSTLNDTIISDFKDFVDFCINPFYHIIELSHAQSDRILEINKEWSGSHVHEQIVHLGNSTILSLIELETTFNKYFYTYKDLPLDSQRVEYLNEESLNTFNQVKEVIQTYWKQLDQILENQKENAS